MSGETEKQVSGWTVDTSRQDLLRIINDLEKYVERRFTDQDKAVQAALLAAKEAVLKAETASEKRFESVNEFRKTLSDQTASFLPRPEYDANHKALEDKIDTKTKATDDKIQTLTDRLNVREGKSTGIATGWGYLLGGLGGIATIVGLILAFNN